MIQIQQLKSNPVSDRELIIAAALDKLDARLTALEPAAPAAPAEPAAPAPDPELPA